MARLFVAPLPKHDERTLLLLSNIESLEYPPPNHPQISNAGFAILAQLVAWRRSLTSYQMGAESKAVQRLITDKLVGLRNRKPEVITLYPRGHKAYEIEYYLRFHKERRRRRKQSVKFPHLILKDVETPPVLFRASLKIPPDPVVCEELTQRRP